MGPKDTVDYIVQGSKKDPGLESEDKVILRVILAQEFKRHSNNTVQRSKWHHVL